MITKILLTGLMSLFLSAGVISINSDCNKSRQSTESAANDITKAIVYNGEIIPMVELPEVEITGVRNTSNIVKAILVDGNVYPLFDIEEVLITPGA